MDQRDRIRLFALVSAIIAGGLIVIFVGLDIYHALVFKVISTNPTVSNVSNQTPFLKVTFSQQLSQKGLSISSSPAVVDSYSVSGATLDIVTKVPMNVGQTYTITIKYIASTGGKSLTNVHLTFQPKDIPISSLPADQQKAIQQKQESYEQNVTNYNGTDALTTVGVSNDQISTLEQAFYKFSQSQAIRPKNVSIDPNSVSTEKFVMDSPSSAVDFSVSFDSTTYKAKLTYYSDLSSIELVLTNPTTGSTAYDSGVLGQ